MKEIFGVDSRISSLEEKVSDLQRQVDVLREIIAASASHLEHVRQVEPDDMPTDSVEMSTDSVETQAESFESPIEPLVAPLSPAAEETQHTTSVSHEEKDFGGIEGKLGKRVMNILASVLVFFSLILFGNLVQPYLTPEIKTGLMFIVSIVFATVGLWKMGDGKGKYANLFTAVAGCGVGAIYISSLVSRFVLETFDDTALLCVIAAWIAVVLVLVKLKSGIFTYICYIGILIATALAVFNWQTSLVALIVYVAAISALFAINFTSSYKKVCWLFAQYPVVCYLMLFAYRDNITYICILYALIFIPLIAQILYYDVKDDSSELMLLNVLLYGIAIYLVLNYISISYVQYHYTANIFIAISCIVVCTLLYKYIDTQKTLFYIPFCISVFLMSQLRYSQFFTDYIGYAAFFIVLLALGCILKKIIFRYAGYVFMFLYLIYQPEALSFWPALSVYVIVLLLMIVWCWKKYDVIEKYILTALVFCAILAIYCNRYCDNSIFFIMAGAVSLIINLPWYYHNRISGEEEDASRRLGYITNELLAVIGIGFISFSDTSVKFIEEISDSSTLALILIVMMTLALACFNIKRLYDTYGDTHEKVLSIYTCFKFTFIILCILCRLHSVSYVTSLIGIVLAIAFICIGFYYRLKGFRLYGLILCLICVAKLLLADVTYSSSLMRPVGYLSAGLLCYLISWIYTKLEKRL